MATTAVVGLGAVAVAGVGAAAVVGVGAVAVLAVALIVGAIAGITSNSASNIQINTGKEHLSDHRENLPETGTISPEFEIGSRPGTSRPGMTITTENILEFNIEGICIGYTTSSGDYYLTEYSIAVQSYPERLRIDYTNSRYYVDYYRSDGTYSGWQDIYDFDGNFLGSIEMPANSRVETGTVEKDETQAGTQVGTQTGTQVGTQAGTQAGTKTETDTPPGNSSGSFNFPGGFGLILIPIIIIAFIAAIVSFSRRNVVTKHRKKLKKIKK